MRGSELRLLALEPYDSGSHAAFLRTVLPAFPRSLKIGMPGRHWKWRMRGSAVWAALRERERLARGHELILASSYLPLAELRGLVPELARTPAVLYFHENQLAFPAREGATPARDLHFAFTQMISALAAQRLLFNSEYNRRSFLDGAAELLARMPDRVPSDWIPRLRERSEVFPYPVDIEGLVPLARASAGPDPAGPLILWNHRWEHDKNPAEFFAALEELDRRGRAFRLAVCGQRFQQAPPEFERARERLAHRLVQFGPLEDRADYLRLLGEADLVVSTAVQEFYGVAVFEAVAAGARPLVPDHLAYPELWPDEVRYPPGRLGAALLELLDDPTATLRADRREWVEPRSAAALLPELVRRLEGIAREEA